MLTSRSSVFESHRKPALRSGVTVSMNSADDIDHQRNPSWECLHQSTSVWPSHRHRIEPEISEPEFSRTFNFNQWLPQMNEMYQPPTEAQIHTAALPWSDAAQQYASPATKQAWQTLDWNIPTDLECHEMGPEMIGMGAWAPESWRAIANEPASPTMVHSAEVPDSQIHLLPVADTRHNFQDQLFVPESIHYHDIVQSNEGRSYLHWPNTSEQPMTSRHMNQLLSPPKHQNVERMLNLRTGEVTDAPRRKKHRPQTQQALVNRDLIRKLGGACRSCRKKKRQVWHDPQTSQWWMLILQLVLI